MPKATTKHAKKAARHGHVARPVRKHPARKPAPAKEPAVTEQEMAGAQGVPVFFEEIDLVEEPEIVGPDIIGLVEL
jgi:hypothetical protein